MIIEDRTFSIKTSALRTKKVRDEGREFLRMLHSRRWVHNDIHKGNVQRKSDGNIAFIDYGYARYYPNDGVDYSDFSAESTFIYGPVNWEVAAALDNVHFDVCFEDDVNLSSKEILRKRRRLYVDRLDRLWRSPYIKDVTALTLNLDKLMCGNKLDLTKTTDGEITTYTFDHRPEPTYDTIKTNLELLRS